MWFAHTSSVHTTRLFPWLLSAFVCYRYRVVAQIDKGAFSRVVQALDLREQRMVSIKVLRNDKDCLDQGFGELRVLARIATADPDGEQPLVRPITFDVPS